MFYSTTLLLAGQDIEHALSSRRKMENKCRREITYVATAAIVRVLTQSQIVLVLQAALGASSGYTTVRQITSGQIIRDIKPNSPGIWYTDNRDNERKPNEQFFNR